MLKFQKTPSQAPEAAVALEAVEVEPVVAAAEPGAVEAPAADASTTIEAAPEAAPEAVTADPAPEEDKPA